MTYSTSLADIDDRLGTITEQHKASTALYEVQTTWENGV